MWAELHHLTQELVHSVRQVVLLDSFGTGLPQIFPL